MKPTKLFIAMLAATLLLGVSCKQKTTVKTTRNMEFDREITRVDRTIDTTNSFNNLFLDSATVRQYIASSGLDESLQNRMQSFYNSRNFQYAWFSTSGLAEQTRAFWFQLENYMNATQQENLVPKELMEKITELLVTDSLLIAKKDSAFQKLELDLTKALYVYAADAHKNDDYAFKTLEYSIPRKKMTVEAMVDSLINARGLYSEAYLPLNPQFTTLKDHLLKYKLIMDNGGWPMINTTKEVLKKGDKGTAILELKKRIKAEGYLTGEDSTFTDVYDDALADAVNRMKVTYGYKPDGTAGKTFINELNVPVKERMQQLLVNMERMRWMPVQERDSGKSVMVNIPEYKLYAYKGGEKVMDMNVVVGTAANSTTLFTSTMKHVVFAPFWGIPKSIIRNEILPAMERNSNYLNSRNMEITGNYADGTPIIRQKPGPHNSLGAVKFLFPNDHDIYFHDTPSKSLFDKDKRTYSHGCIRLSEPELFAQYVLEGNSEWTPEKIREGMQLTEEKWVNVKDHIPVLLTYFTAWVQDGLLNFREDIYRHDEVFADKMFTDNVETTQRGEKPAVDSTQLKPDTAAAKPVASN